MGRAPGELDAMGSGPLVMLTAGVRLGWGAWFVGRGRWDVARRSLGLSSDQLQKSVSTLAL